MIDLHFTAEQDAFRAEVREWMSVHVPARPLQSLDGEVGFAQHREWEKTLAQGNWGMVTWPKAYGGRGASLIDWLIFEEEYYRAGAPLRVNQNGIFLLGPALMEYGTEAQKRRFLPAMASGEEVWAQAWSEPQAGSDMAAIRASATRDGDSYILRGHKIWSSRAAFADWCFGLFRTDASSDRHKGLIFLLFPLKYEGVRVRGIRQIHGEPGFAEIFFEDARIPIDLRLGADGQGWSIAMATAGFERGLMLRSPARFQMAARRLVKLYRSKAKNADPAVAAAVAQAWMDAEAYSFHTYMTASRLMAGGKIGVEASINKIFWSELDLSLHRAAMGLLGAYAELLPLAPDVREAGAWLEGWMFAHAGPIYAGSNEIQRTLIAERLMGLPRV